MKPSLTFPNRLVAGGLGLIVIGLAVWAVRAYVWGHVALATEQKGLVVVLPNSQIRPLPATVRLKPGRYTLVVTGDGFYRRSVGVAVWPFLTAKIAVTLESRPDPATLPLADQLPYFEPGKFEIGSPRLTGVYTITLLAKPAWFDSPAAHEAALRANKQAALAWLKARRVDGSQIKIEYLPRDPG